jgi:hypothetical protein
VAAKHSTLTAAQPLGLQPGDTITIGGVFAPDRRWWPRLLNWLLRRPPPMTEKLQQFRVTEASGSTVEVRR